MAFIGLPEETRTTCRLGGLPDMPSTLQWPLYEATPMTFLAQVDLSQLPKTDGLAWLPPSGFLFYFAGQRAGEWVEEASAVLYSEERSLEPRTPPEDAAVSAQEQSIRFEIRKTYEPLSADHDACNDEDNREIDYWYYKLVPRFPLWQIGGWLRPIQSHDMPLRAERRRRGVTSLYRGQEGDALDLALSGWRLLGQFDLERLFEGTSGYSHGYFWIKFDDSQCRHFEQAVLLGQAG